MVEGSQTVMRDMFKSLLRIGHHAKMPILFTNLFLSRSDPLVEFIQSKGLPLYLPEVAPKIMSLMWQYAHYRQRLGNFE
jgi:hypothetical protein